MSIDWTDEDDREEEERVRRKESDLFAWAYWDAIYREWCARPFGQKRKAAETPEPSPSDDDVMAELRKKVPG